VRDEYGRLYGAEAKFFAGNVTGGHQARRLFCEWLADVEGVPLPALHGPACQAQSVSR
jgi:hypothetical protein